MSVWCFLLRANMYLCGVSVSEEHFYQVFLVLFSFTILFYDPTKSQLFFISVNHFSDLLNSALSYFLSKFAWFKDGGTSTLRSLCDYNMPLGVLFFMVKIAPTIVFPRKILWKQELYQKIFGDDEKLKMFLRWRVQILEKGIKLLDFNPGGFNAMIQITDLKNIPKK